MTESSSRVSFIWRLGLLVVLILGPILIFGVTRKKNLRAEDFATAHADVQEAPMTNPDYIFIGNSMMNTRIDEEHFSELLRGARAKKYYIPGSGPGNWVRIIKERVLPDEANAKRIFIFFVGSPFFEPMYPENFFEDFKLSLSEAIYEHPWRLQADAMKKYFLSLAAGNDSSVFMTELNSIFSFGKVKVGQIQELQPVQAPFFSRKTFLDRLNQFAQVDRLKICLVQIYGAEDPKLQAYLTQSSLHYLNLHEEIHVPLFWHEDQQHIRKDSRRSYTELFTHLAREELQ